MEHVPRRRCEKQQLFDVVRPGGRAYICISLCAGAMVLGFLMVECPSVGEADAASNLLDAGGQSVLEGTARPEVVAISDRDWGRAEVSDDNGRVQAISTSVSLFVVFSVLTILCMCVAPAGSNWRVVGLITMIGVTMSAFFASSASTSYFQDARAVLSRDGNGLEMEVACWGRVHTTSTIPLDASPVVYQCRERIAGNGSYSVGLAWNSDDNLKVLWLMTGIMDSISASELASKLATALNIPVVRKQQSDRVIDP